MKRKHRARRRVIPIAAALAAAAIGIASAADGGAERLAAERARWEAAQVGAYRYSYQKYCECYRGEPPVTVVIVRGGRAEQVHHRYRNPDHEVAVDETSAEYYWTIDELFGRLARALERDAVVRVEYDAELGYPTSIFIDDDPDSFGGEIDFRRIEVEPL